MKVIGKISILHLVLLAMTSIGLKNHVTLIPPILEVAKRDGWISVLISMFIFFAWVFIIVMIQKQTKSQAISLWLKDKVGKTVANIILYCTILFIYLLAAFTMRETILWISSTFLNYTPQIILLVVYIIVCFLLVSTNIQTIVTTNAFILFIIIVFGYYVAIVNMQVKNYQLLFPLFEHGITPVMKGIVYPASGLIELIFIVFLQHHLKDQLKWRHMAIMVVILIGLTLGPLTGAIAEFGPEEAARQKYPAYEEWGLVTLGRFIEHMDFLSIHQWLSGTFIRVSLLLFIVADILNVTGKPKKIWLWMMPPFFFINLILYVVDDTFFLKVNNHFFSILTVIFLFLLSVVLFAISFIKKKDSKESVNENVEGATKH